ncbi:hypothetical protein E3G52_000349 [Mycobacteroides abscessus]|uniref:hypothetical protein n=1 Tax=Mycobacteroides abscessus TaxID=36809 RepID=UPI0018781EF0|nr:hypothetical protein [Mycobacteroides abscessus]MBE5453485.1 hypothetical protein [Mycobacteroides abscessus]
MADRLEIRHNDRIIYAQDIDSYSIEIEDGTLALAAIQAGPTGTVIDGVISVDHAPVSLVTAPDAHLDEQPGTDPAVLERVHTGDAYTQTAGDPDADADKETDEK